MCNLLSKLIHAVGVIAGMILTAVGEFSKFHVSPTVTLGSVVCCESLCDR